MDIISTSPAFDKAKEYVDSGFCVIPLSIETNEPIPEISIFEFQYRKPNDEELCSWFNDSTKIHAIGLMCGGISGIVIVNIDMNQYDRTIEKHVEFFNTHVVQTQNNQLQLYYQWHKETPIPTVLNIAPGVDVYGEGVFVPVTNSSTVPKRHIFQRPPRKHLCLAPPWINKSKLSFLKSINQDQSKVDKYKFDPLADENEVTVCQKAAFYLPKKYRGVFVWGGLKEWAKINKPELPEDELRSIFELICWTSVKNSYIKSD